MGHDENLDRVTSVEHPTERASELGRKRRLQARQERERGSAVVAAVAEIAVKGSGGVVARCRGEERTGTAAASNR